MCGSQRSKASPTLIAIWIKPSEAEQMILISDPFRLREPVFPHI